MIKTIFKWIVVGFTTIIFLSILLLAIMPNPMKEEFSFVSPSGEIELMVEEGCLGHACSHDIKINSGIIPFINTKQCNRYIADGILFEDVEVEWSKDEKIITWKKRDTVSPTNIINVNSDCKNQIMILWDSFLSNVYNL